MNVLIISGSPNNKSSHCDYISRILMKELSSPSISVSYLNVADLNIEYCRGCMECFKGKACFLEDDIRIIEREMDESDLIVFISPVYVHQVPGIVKTTIDRLAYLTHLMPFIGKAGVIVSVSATNGNDYVVEYITKVMEYLGITIIEKLNIAYGLMKHEITNSFVMNLADAIKHYMRNGKLIASEKQQQIFEMYSKKYSNEIGPEAECWKKQGYLNYVNIQDLINKKAIAVALSNSQK